MSNQNIGTLHEDLSASYCLAVTGSGHKPSSCSKAVSGSLDGPGGTIVTQMRHRATL